MAELGPETAQAQREVGKRAAELGLDMLVTAGHWADETANAAKAEGLAAVHSFPDLDSASKALVALVHPGDVVLLKASRASGFERIGEALKLSE
jgi:UDP-N-acetylmuramyl pentapeptide synthase